MLLLGEIQEVTMSVMNDDGNCSAPQFCDRWKDFEEKDNKQKEEI